MKYIKNIWNFLGAPDAWLAIFFVSVIVNIGSGGTLAGYFWVALTIFSYFLCRISESLESIAKRGD